MIIKWTLPPTSSRVALPYCCGTNKLKFTPATGLEKRRYDQAHFKINFVKSSQSPSSENHKNKQEVNTPSPLKIINEMSAATKGK